MWRRISGNADIAVFAVVAVFATGLFTAWAAHGFSWASPQRESRPVRHEARPTLRGRSVHGRPANAATQPVAKVSAQPTKPTVSAQATKPHVRATPSVSGPHAPTIVAS